MTVPTGRWDLDDAIAHLRGRWAWFVTFGALAAAFGIGALVLTTTATIASTFLIAIFMIVVGGAEIGMGLDAHRWSSKAPLILLGLLYIVAGAFVIARPLTGAAGFTLLLGASLLAAGVARVLFAARLPHGPSVYVLLAGIVTTLLGMMILFGWPENSAFVLGLFLGVDLLFYGASWIGFGLFLRRN